MEYDEKKFEKEIFPKIKEIMISMLKEGKELKVNQLLGVVKIPSNEMVPEFIRGDRCLLITCISPDLEGKFEEFCNQIISYLNQQ